MTNLNELAKNLSDTARNLQRESERLEASARHLLAFVQRLSGIFTRVGTEVTSVPVQNNETRRVNKSVKHGRRTASPGSQERAVYEFLKANGPVHRKLVAEALNVPLGRVSGIIYQLQRKGAASSTAEGCWTAVPGFVITPRGLRRGETTVSLGNYPGATA